MVGKNTILKRMNRHSNGIISCWYPSLLLAVEEELLG
jgi:hypothetical protein